MLIVLLILTGCTYSLDAKPIYVKKYVRVVYQGNIIHQVLVDPSLRKEFDQTNEVEMKFVDSIHFSTPTKKVKNGQVIRIYVSYDPELYEQINYHFYPLNGKYIKYTVKR